MKRKYILTTLLCVCIFSLTSLLLASSPRIRDSAGLLSTDEISKLETSLQEFMDNHKMEAVILITNDIGNKTPKEYALDYFNANNYGYGDTKDGIILMINMSTRKFNISSNGSAVKYLTNSRLESIKAGITPHLSKGNYYKAFEVFIDQTSDYISAGLQKGDSISYSDGKKLFTDSYNQPLGLSDYLICAGVGVLVASIIAFTTRYFIARSYKNPKHVTPLAFPDSNSVNYTEVRDILVSSYTTQTKIERPDDNDFSGGGSDNDYGGSIDGDF